MLSYKAVGKPSAVAFLLCALVAVAYWPRSPRAVASPEKEYDVVVMGATGFLGRMGAAAFIGFRGEFKGVPKDTPLTTSPGRTKVALAGRHIDSLQALLDGFASAGANVDGVDLLVADFDDPASLDDMVARAKIIVNFAGENWDYDTVDTMITNVTADSLIMKCAVAGTHFIDASMMSAPMFTKEDVSSSTGLGPTLTKVDKAARASGAVISPSTGCIAAPHELVTTAAVQALGGEAPKSITQYEMDYYPGVKKEMLKKDGSNAFPFDMMFNVSSAPPIAVASAVHAVVSRTEPPDASPCCQPIDKSKEHLLGKVPVEQSLMEVLTQPMMSLLSAQMGWGKVPFQMYTPTNNWFYHFEYVQTGKADVAFRKSTRYLVVAEVEGVDGTIQTSHLHYYEGIYEGTVRETVEMALSLLYQTEQVKAAQTGGVFTTGAGWGPTLIANLKAVGANMTLEKPGIGAEPVVNAWTKAHGMTSR